MSGGNFSSGFNMAGVQNSQDQKCNASSTSNSESDGKEYVKSEERLLPHTSVEFELSKLETEGNGLGCLVPKKWCKAIWWKLKKQAKRITNSKSDTDSSSDESISDEKEKIFQTSQQRSINLHMIKTPSDLTRNKSNKYFVLNENLTNSNSEDVEVKIESWESVKCKKISQPSKVCILQQRKSEYVNPMIPQGFIQSQYRNNEVMEDTPRHEVENVVEEGREVTSDNFQEDLKNLEIPEILDSFDIKDEMHDEYRNNEVMEDTPRHEVENVVEEGREVTSDNFQEDLKNLEIPEILDSFDIKDEMHDEYRNNEVMEDTPRHEVENVVEEGREVTSDNFQEDLKNLEIPEILDSFDIKDEMHDEYRNNEVMEDTPRHEVENVVEEGREVTSDNFQEDLKNLEIPEILDSFDIKDEMHDEYRNNEVMEDTPRHEVENVVEEGREVTSDNFQEDLKNLEIPEILDSFDIKDEMHDEYRNNEVMEDTPRHEVENVVEEGREVTSDNFQEDLKNLEIPEILDSFDIKDEMHDEYRNNEVMEDTPRHEVENVVEEGREVTSDNFQEDLKNLEIPEILDSFDIKDEMHDEYRNNEVMEDTPRHEVENVVEEGREVTSDNFQEDLKNLEIPEILDSFDIKDEMHDEYRNNEVMEDTPRHEVENVVEEGREVTSDNFQEDLKNLEIPEILDSFDIKDEMHDEYRNNEVMEDTPRHEVENVVEEGREVTSDNFQEDLKNLEIPEILDSFDIKDEMHDELSTYEDWKEKIEIVVKACNILKYKDSLALFNFLVEIITGEEPVELSTYEKWKEKIEAVEKACNILTDKLSTYEDWKEEIELVVKACNILKYKIYNSYLMQLSDAIHETSQVKIGVTDLINFDLYMQSSKDPYKDALTDVGVTDQIKNVSAGERSKQESTPVKLYRNVMQNETCRMMTGIDMVMSEAKRLFGNERTQIFFDLLDDGLFCFGLSGAAPSFIPNMTQSTVRQHVISFFEHSCDTMNRLMTLLLGCPDSKILQQMPEQHFISLMRSVIDSSLKAKTKGGKFLSLKESTFIMVDSEEFERALGEDIPEDVLDRLKHGEEVVAQKFVDTKIGITQASEGRENSPIHFIYFPSDCHLFIYIPTEKGSYWHQMNMQRENRIRRHNK